MENASQALLIAGGILLAILTLSLIVLMRGNLSRIGQAQLNEEELQRLNSWNEEWEAYNKKVLYGADVLTVINKAQQNNDDYEYDARYTVNVDVKDKDGNSVLNAKSYVGTKKTSIFTCEKMERNNDTGRIQNIVFKFLE